MPLGFIKIHSNKAVHNVLPVSAFRLDPVLHCVLDWCVHFISLWYHVATRAPKYTPIQKVENATSVQIMRLSCMGLTIARLFCMQ